MKTILATICLVVIGIAIPHGKIAAQQLDNQLQHHSTATALEDDRREWDQRHQGQSLVLSLRIVNANTFETIAHPMELIAHGVTDLDEARWNIRRQLGFPEASDVRTVGGVSQRILWLEAWVHGVQCPPPCHCPWQDQQEFTHAQQMQQMPGVQQILPRWR